jgi:hypothetical protein
VLASWSMHEMRSMRWLSGITDIGSQRFQSIQIVLGFEQARSMKFWGYGRPRSVEVMDKPEEVLCKPEHGTVLLTSISLMSAKAWLKLN